MRPGYSELKSVRVDSIKWETRDTAILRLSFVEEEDGRRYSFKPGQFNMLYVPGVGEAAISISSSPEARGFVEHAVRAVGYTTRALTGLREGDVIGLRGPYGNSWPLESAVGQDILIVAGGIGLPPLRPAIYYLLKNLGKYNSVKLLYGARTPKDLMYTYEYESWRDGGIEVHVTVDRGDETWKGNVGVVTTLFNKVEIKPRTAKVFMCGPEVMFKFAARDLMNMGFKPEDIYVSLERRMKCGIGLCGHCQLAGFFVCTDGPIFTWERVGKFLTTGGI